MLPLTLLKGIDPKRVTIAVLVIVILGLSAFVYRQHVELEQTRLVYSNPQTVRTGTKQKEQGPKVVYRTRIKYLPSGEKSEETNEVAYDAGSYKAESDSETSSPVPLSVGLANSRTDRWLLRAGTKLSVNSEVLKNYKVGVGYGFRNRLDLVVEYLRHEDRNEAWADATLRF
jgi:hypothetical protein